MFRALLILLSVLAAYSTSLDGPFVFDDEASIVENPAIRPAGSVLSQPGNTPIAGRPVVALSFAFNYAIGELEVRGYHLTNIVIHIICSLLLFELVRRTLTLPQFSATYGRRAPDLAFAVALLWALHPLNSEVVNYVTERTESMMAMFYLATLYASLRAAGGSGFRAPRAGFQVPGSRKVWEAVAVVACALGMGCKESMATAPMMVLLYDRVFLFDSLRHAITSRWRFYGFLALTWLPLAYLVVPGPRAGSAGFSTSVQPWVYLLNQAPIIVRYMRLVFWPTDLVLDYGPPLPLTIGDVLPYMAALIALVVLGVVALRRRPEALFLVAWMFITLAPTSSIVPIATQVGAERRMYLPLMAIVTLIVMAAYGLSSIRSRVTTKAAFAVLAVAAVMLATATIARTAEYDDALVLAHTVLARWPTDKAHGLVGSELAQQKRDDEAIAHLRIAAKTDARAQYNLGVSLFNTKRYDEAVEALASLPLEYPWREEAPWSRRVMGHAHMLQRRWPQAITEFRQVLAMTPGDAQTRRLLTATLDRQGIDLGTAGRFEDARRAFRAALDLDPKNASLHHNLATALADSGDLAGAEAEAQQAIALNPLDASSYNLLGRALALQGRMADALVQLEYAVRISPDPAFRDDLQRVRSRVQR